MAFFKSITRREIKKAPTRLFFNRPLYSDPFRINADYSLILLLACTFGFNNTLTVLFLTVILTLSEVYIIYISLMSFIFKRAPVIHSDYSLLKTGITLLKSSRLLILILFILSLTGIAYFAYIANTYLLSHAQEVPSAIFIALIALFIPGVHKKWKKTKYPLYHGRVIFSCCVHLVRENQYSAYFKQLSNIDKSQIDSANIFGSFKLLSKPNIVHCCIESYGSLLFTNKTLNKEFSDYIHTLQKRLDQAGFYVASHFSESPIYAGGSWLSYTSFMYGLRVDQIQLYEILFERDDNFNAYESLFDLLKHNGYYSGAACPIGGVPDQLVDWTSINRLFRNAETIDWEKLNYKGKHIGFFGQEARYVAPDQYTLNYSYDYLKDKSDQPLSLFFCTTNSHIPWNSPTKIADNWKDLNNPDYAFATTNDSPASKTEKYIESIKYQLDFLCDFLIKNSNDNLVLILFGDHQPPLLTAESDGKKTPIHVISKDKSFTDHFIANGFSPDLDLSHHTGGIFHEAFMSYFLNAMQGTYGTDTKTQWPILSQGSKLFEKSEP